MQPPRHRAHGRAGAARVVLDDADRLPVHAHRRPVAACSRQLYKLNPLVWIVITFQRAIYNQPQPESTAGPGDRSTSCRPTPGSGTTPGTWQWSGASRPCCSASPWRTSAGRGELLRGALTCRRRSRSRTSRATSACTTSATDAEGATAPLRPHPVRRLLGAPTTSTSRSRRARRSACIGAQRLGEVDAAEVHRRHPAADRRARSGARAGSPRCSSSAPASSPSSRDARTSSSTARILGMSQQRARRAGSTRSSPSPSSRSSSTRRCASTRPGCTCGSGSRSR